VSGDIEPNRSLDALTRECRDTDDCCPTGSCRLDAARAAEAEAAQAAAENLAEARRQIAEHEQQQTEACLAEVEAVLAKYGRKLVITQPQITIAPM
jgi:hypothetical protein